MSLQTKRVRKNWPHNLNPDTPPSGGLIPCSRFKLLGQYLIQTVSPHVICPTTTATTDADTVMTHALALPSFNLIKSPESDTPQKKASSADLRIY